MTPVTNHLASGINPSMMDTMVVTSKQAAWNHGAFNMTDGFSEIFYFEYSDAMICYAALNVCLNCYSSGRTAHLKGLLFYSKVASKLILAHCCHSVSLIHQNRFCMSIIPCISVYFGMFVRFCFVFPKVFSMYFLQPSQEIGCKMVVLGPCWPTGLPPKRLRCKFPSGFQTPRSSSASTEV